MAACVQASANAHASVTRARGNRVARAPASRVVFMGGGGSRVVTRVATQEARHAPRGAKTPAAAWIRAGPLDFQRTALRNRHVGLVTASLAQPSGDDVASAATGAKAQAVAVYALRISGSRL